MPATKTKLQCHGGFLRLLASLGARASENIQFIPAPIDYPCVAVTEHHAAEYDYWSVEYVYVSDFD